jgi:hypothetical protein
MRVVHVAVLVFPQVYGTIAEIRPVLHDVPGTCVATGKANISAKFQLTSQVILAGLSYSDSKGKAIPLQALTGPEGSRRLRLPDFKTIGT